MDAFNALYSSVNLDLTKSDSVSDIKTVKSLYPMLRNKWLLLSSDPDGSWATYLIMECVKTWQQK